MHGLWTSPHCSSLNGFESGRVDAPLHGYDPLPRGSLWSPWLLRAVRIPIQLLERQRVEARGFQGVDSWQRGRQWGDNGLENLSLENRALEPCGTQGADG